MKTIEVHDLPTPPFLETKEDEMGFLLANRRQTPKFGSKCHKPFSWIMQTMKINDT